MRGPSGDARTTRMSGLNSIRIWRQAPQGGQGLPKSPSPDPATATATGSLSPRATIAAIALRSAHMERP